MASAGLSSSTPPQGSLAGLFRTQAHRKAGRLACLAAVAVILGLCALDKENFPGALVLEEGNEDSGGLLFFSC